VPSRGRPSLRLNIIITAPGERVIFCSMRAAAARCGPYCPFNPRCRKVFQRCRSDGGSLLLADRACLRASFQYTALPRLDRGLSPDPVGQGQSREEVSHDGPEEPGVRGVPTGPGRYGRLGFRNRFARRNLGNYSRWPLPIAAVCRASSQRLGRDMGRERPDERLAA
jgi:hypothetical protein